MAVNGNIRSRLETAWYEKVINDNKRACDGIKRFSNF